MSSSKHTSITYKLFIQGLNLLVSFGKLQSRILNKFRSKDKISELRQLEKEADDLIDEIHDKIHTPHDNSDLKALLLAGTKKPTPPPGRIISELFGEVDGNNSEPTEVEKAKMAEFLATIKSDKVSVANVIKELKEEK